mgnify:CR=1 FL=1
MERTESDSMYFHIPNLVVKYLNLKKDEIYPILSRDLNYLIHNRLQDEYYDAHNFLLNLMWFLGTDSKTKPASLIDDISWPIKINFYDILIRIYNVYHS